MSQQELMSPIVSPLLGGIIGIVGALSGAVVGAFVQKYLRERGTLYCNFPSLDLKFQYGNDLRDVYGLDVSDGALVFRDRDRAGGLKAKRIEFDLKVNFYNQKDVYTGLRNLHVVFRLMEEGQSEKLPLPVAGMLPKSIIQGNELALRPKVILAEEIELPDPSWNIETRVASDQLKRRWKAINLPPKTWTEVAMSAWASLNPRSEDAIEDLGNKDLYDKIPLTAFGSIELFGQFPNGEIFRKEIAKIG